MILTRTHTQIKNMALDQFFPCHCNRTQYRYCIYSYEFIQLSKLNLSELNRTEKLNNNLIKVIHSIKMTKLF